MGTSTYHRLIRRGLLSEQELRRIAAEAAEAGHCLADRLQASGIPKHELLLALSARYGVPFVEFDESVIVSQQIVRRMDMERLKQALWLPLSIGKERAEVISASPDDPSVLRDIRATLGIEHLDLRVALPSDLIRIIEHNQDINPRFPPAAGRTPLAKVRTLLAGRRSQLACARTTLARGRTGLALLRTGLSFVTIALILFRVFGAGSLAVVEFLLLLAGVAAAADGLYWYLPARKQGRSLHDCGTSALTGGTTVLTGDTDGRAVRFSRSAEVSGAGALRRDWNRLSPVMRRRFLASDRTDLAEERTVLACHRTVMARARTGLAFMRTGAAFIGLGIALIRQFPINRWTVADAVIIGLGTAMAAEGLFWYLPGRKAAAEGSETMNRAEKGSTIWDRIFPFLKQGPAPGGSFRFPPRHLSGYRSPGIWATTGLALERTLLAERRNVMARLRTVMARARTGMAFIRTGISLASIGMGLLVYFGAGNAFWTILECGMIVSGILFAGDGLAWYLPAERTRRQFPYCFGEMEIADADYARPVSDWRKAVYSHDEI